MLKEIGTVVKCLEIVALIALIAVLARDLFGRQQED